MATAVRSNPNKKIAYVTSRFPKLSETFILYEMIELQKLGSHVDVFALIQENEAVMHTEAKPFVERAYFAKPYAWKVIRSQFYWLLRRPSRYLKSWYTVIKENIGSKEYLLRALIALPQGAWFGHEMQKSGIDHIHAHWATHSALAAFVASQLSDIPYSFTAHANDIFVDQSMLATKIDQAAFVVTISEFNRRFLEKTLNRSFGNKIQILHCGVDIEVFKPKPELAPEVGSPFTITCLGRLDHKKAQSVLVSACHQLLQKGHDFRCWFIGDGPDRAKLTQQIKDLGLTEQVTLLGSQPRSRVSELLAQSDVMVLPSVDTPSGRKEGIPVSMMEAMAMEKPVIGTILSGIPELIDDDVNGYLVPQHNVEQLVTALEKLAADPEKRRQMGVAGRKKVVAEFDLRANSQKLYHLLQRDWSDGSAQQNSTPTSSQIGFQGDLT